MSLFPPACAWDVKTEDREVKYAKILAILIAGIVAMLVGTHVFLQVMGWMTVFMWFIAGITMASGVGYLGYVLLLKGKLPQPKRISSYKVFDSSRRQVYLFRDKPSVSDLVSMGDELKLAQLELAGDAFPVRNEEQVTVLDDNGVDAIHVRIKSADKKSRDREGWVCRSSLVKE